MDARTVEENKKSRGGVKPSCFRFKTFYGAGWCVDTPAALKRFLAYATLQFECDLVSILNFKVRVASVECTITQFYFSR